MTDEPMSFDTAREKLSFHCGAHPSIEDERWENGFLQLAGRAGGLPKEAMLDVTDCVDAVESHLCAAENLDRQVISSLWGIIHFARAWSIDPESSAVQEGRVSEQDREELRAWVDDLSYRIAMMLDTGQPE